MGEAKSVQVKAALGDRVPTQPSVDGDTLQDPQVRGRGEPSDAGPGYRANKTLCTTQG